MTEKLPIYGPTEATAESQNTRLNRHRPSSFLQRIAQSTRAKIGAAGLAFAGAGTAATVDTPKAQAAIVIPGEFVDNVNEQPERALALDNFNVSQYNIGNADGTGDKMVQWYGVEITQPHWEFDFYLDAGSDVPYTVLTIDQIPHGMRSKLFLVMADLPELSGLRYALAANNGVSTTSLNVALRNARVAVGYGGFTGDPYSITTLDEAISMTNPFDEVLVGTYGADVNNNDAWILKPVDIPTVIPGDYNRDGYVDSADYNEWRDQFGTVFNATADGDGDGDTDGRDLLIGILISRYPDAPPRWPILVPCF